jgi:hypothetical protein
MLMDTITQVEDQIVDTLKSAQQPAVDAVRRAAEYVADLLPENRPEVPFAEQLPAPAELVENAYAFAQTLLDVNHQYAKALLDAVSPLIGSAPAAPVLAPTKSTKNAPAAA